MIALPHYHLIMVVFVQLVHHHNSGIRILSNVRFVNLVLFLIRLLAIVWNVLVISLFKLMVFVLLVLLVLSMEVLTFVCIVVLVLSMMHKLRLVLVFLNLFAHKIPFLNLLPKNANVLLKKSITTVPTVFNVSYLSTGTSILYHARAVHWVNISILQQPHASAVLKAQPTTYQKTHAQ